MLIYGFVLSINVVDNSLWEGQSTKHGSSSLLATIARVSAHVINCWAILTGPRPPRVIATGGQPSTVSEWLFMVQEEGTFQIFALIRALSACFFAHVESLVPGNAESLSPDRGIREPSTVRMKIKLRDEERRCLKIVAGFGG